MIFKIEKLNVSLICLVGVLYFSACQSKIEAPEAWFSHAEQAEDFNQSKTLKGLVFSAFLEPKAYTILREHHELFSGSNRELFDSLMAENTDYQYAQLSIKTQDGNTPVLRYGISDAGSYQSRVSYLAFEMQHRVFLEQGNMKIPCVLYHFERSYDLAPQVKCLLAFPSQFNSEDPITLVVEDSHFNTGPIRLQFDPKPLTETPNLKIQ